MSWTLWALIAHPLGHAGARQLERAAEQLADVEPDVRRKPLNTNAAELDRISLPA